MRDDDFKLWMTRAGYDPGTISTQLARAKRLDQTYGDLDEHFDRDKFTAIAATLKYSAQDKRDGTPNPSKLDIDGDFYSNLASYRATLNFYQRFRDDDQAGRETRQPKLGDARFSSEVTKMMHLFEQRMPDFTTFAEETGQFWEYEGQYKRDARDAVIAAATDFDQTDAECGRRVFKALVQGTQQGLPLSWRTYAEIGKAEGALEIQFYETVASLARLEAGDHDGLLRCARQLESLREAGISVMRRGEVLGIAISVYGTVNVNDACWYKARTFDRLGKALLGHKLFPSPQFEIAEFEEFQWVMNRIRDQLDDWNWQTGSLTDVQGFIWVATATTWGEAQVADLTREAVEQAMDECEEIGVDAFLEKYKFGKPRDYWTRREPDGMLFPAKATVGVAHGYMPGGSPQSAKEFYGGFGEQAANGILQRLGFEIVSGKAETLPPRSDRKVAPPMKPTNLILFGPPGTGKTYATAAEAVRLCGEEVPDDRDALMKAYRRLADAKRIEFVTFHQSMSYEDFVEGKQPVTGGDGEESSGGFRLETFPGIFRRIARRAETSISHSTGPDAIRIDGRQVFKTSIGEAANPEDAYLFDEAISQGHTLLGFEDIDWSDDKYASREAIIDACREQGDREGDLNAQTGRVQMPFIFRNWVKPGDLLIVSKGNSLFRAIGEVTGGYEFAPRPEGGYAHRRKVRWLWVDRDGVPVSEIYQRKFSMRTIYLLTKDELNVAALERYINSQQPTLQAAPSPDHFVLIIDEINRANISKVFGELITLLEPDKRLGQENEIKVRLPYSEDEFGVPSNLHIVGTMNTADRSIALLDTALRRRFDFKEMLPDPDVLAGASDRTGIDLPKVLKTLNERIEYMFDREHQIGHAYFLGCESRAELDHRMRFRIIPLLAEYFFEDWTKVALVLGDREGSRFLEKIELRPPLGLEDDGEAPTRWRWNVRSEFAEDAYAGLM